ncbi:MAG: hypothetical protein ACXWT1_12475 [Methylobacter sp.]
MKMKNYRLFLLGFVTISLMLLTGFQKPSVSHARLAEKQAASVNVKKLKLKSKGSPVNSKRQEAKSKHSVASAKNSAIEATGLQKSLDLSMPFKDSESAWLKMEQSRMAQRESSAMFAVEKRKKLRPVVLNGQMLMSQEPEVDKQKSLDGAGIVITLKR